MKQNDIALVLIAVFVGAILSIFVSKSLFGTSNRQTNVEVVEPISSEFTQPDERFFNTSSFNPTQNIQIGGTNQTKAGQ